MNTATSTSAGSCFEGQSNGVTHRVHVSAQDNDTTTTSANAIANGSTSATEELKKAFRKKYRHVEAVHSASKPSCLSHDTTETPSFLGFRNLMVIVLGNAPCSFCLYVLSRYTVADINWQLLVTSVW